MGFENDATVNTCKVISPGLPSWFWKWRYQENFYSYQSELKAQMVKLANYLRLTSLFNFKCVFVSFNERPRWRFETFSLSFVKSPQVVPKRERWYYLQKPRVPSIIRASVKVACTQCGGAHGNAIFRFEMLLINKKLFKQIVKVLFCLYYKFHAISILRDIMLL